MDQKKIIPSGGVQLKAPTTNGIRLRQIGTNFLLFFLLIIWPLSSYILMKEQGTGLSAIGAKELNLSTQVYLPTILIQILVFLLIFLILLLGKENLSSIGLGLQSFSFRNLFIGAILWLGISSLLLALSLFLKAYNLFTPPEVSYLLPRTQTQKILWIIMALSASLSEESAFRGFVLTRLNFYLKNFWLTILIASLSFSLGHLYQGPVGMIFAGIYGVSFSLLFLWRKSLSPCIIAHFLQDITPLFAPL